jgi:hypothetical protein
MSARMSGRTSGRTSAGLVVGTYRRLIRLYPRAFRDAYGDDLVDLLAEQLRDEPAWRVVPRCVTDLALTVPSQHLEAHMDRARSLNPVLTTGLGALAAAAVVVGLVVGHPAVLLACAVVAITMAGLALLNHHRARPLTTPRPTSAHWWKVTTAGVALLAILIAVTNATGELPEGGWLVAMITGLTALLLIGAGLVLGVVHLASRPSRPAT